MNNLPITFKRCAVSYILTNSHTAILSPLFYAGSPKSGQIRLAYRNYLKNRELIPPRGQVSKKTRKLQNILIF